MSSLTQDADGRLTLDWNANGRDYTATASADGRWFSVLFGGVIVTVPVPTAAVAEKLAELFATAGRPLRDAEQAQLQQDYRERIGGATK